MANKGSGREAKGKDWRNLGPRCYGCGKGWQLWVDDKRALLHYVRNTMSQMKQATQWLLWCENEIKVHLDNKQLIPVGFVYERVRYRALEFFSVRS